MRVLIRTDAGGVHGLGHAARCLALATVLARHGVEVRFITETPVLKNIVDPFPVCAAKCASCLQADVCVVDTKAPIAEAWYPEFARVIGCKMVRIDHPHATPGTCEALIGPVAHWDARTIQRLQRDFLSKLHYGWPYIMLSDAVRQDVVRPYWQRTQASMVFCAGGSDPTNALAQMIRWTQGFLPDVQKVFCYGAMQEDVVGTYHRLHTMIEDDTDTHRTVMPFHPSHLREAALVVTTFGVTAYECLYYQTPMILLAHTDENSDASDIFARHTARHTSIDLGLLAHCAPEYFQQMLRRTWHYVDDRQYMADHCAGLVDGRGVDRVARVILDLA